jgi:uncharacterized protein with FMN-binding domain
MKRTPLVLAATVAGLTGVLVFHTTPSRLNLSTTPSILPQTQAPQPQQAPQRSPATQTPKAKPRATGTRTVNGPAVNYSYGILSVSVTVSGGKITNVGIASLNDGGDPRSQLIDQQSVPILEQETMQAQSASIQGVSGASYTSAGFQQSLQSALQTLGLR